MKAVNGWLRKTDERITTDALDVSADFNPHPQTLGIDEGPAASQRLPEPS